MNNWMLETRKLDADTFDLVRKKEEIQPKGEREKVTQMKKQALGFLVLLLTAFVTGIKGDQGIAELRSYVSGSLKSDEVCQMEDFQAKCEAGEVIVIRSAKLGRLAMGRCIKDTKHELGCFVDVIVEMDRLCSGRRECVVKVDDGTLKRSTNCHHDLKNHLWATHECVKVTLPADNCDVLRLQSGVLSNFVTESSMCGLTESPWVIEVNRGQRINVTLVDFASSVSHLSKHHHQQQQQQQQLGSEDESSALYPRRCRVYATIREAGSTHGNSRTVCGGPDRVNAVFLSVGEKIEIRFLTSRAVQKPSAKQQDSVYFLLQFNAVGCADLKLPEDMWMRRMTGSSDTATVGCDQSNLSWQLTCKDNQWKGHHGNCSTDRSVSAALGMPHALSTMIIVIIALTVSCVILTIGVLCIKRRIVEEREVRRLQREIRSQCEADYGVGTMSSESKLGPVVSSSAAAAAAHHPSSAGTVLLADPTGNEYARMRLQRMTDYAGCPPYGFDAPNSYGGGGNGGGGGGGGQGCGYKYPTVEHVYESPDSLRRDDSLSRRNPPHYTSRIHGGGGDQRQAPLVAGAGAGVGRPAKPPSPQASARVVVVGPSSAAQEPGAVQGGPCTTPNKSKNAGNYSL